MDEPPVGVGLGVGLGRTSVGRVIWHHYCVNILKIRSVQIDQFYYEFYFDYNNIYLLQLGCHPVAVVILHVNKTWNWLQLHLSQEG